MTTSTPTNPAQEARDKQRLPLAGLIALATTGFITVMTEAMPAGILPALSADLTVTPALAGQFVTAYAIGSAVAALPLTAATIGWPRRRLLLLAVAGFAATNLVAALSSDYMLTMIARFGAGVVAGLVWALLAGYSRRMVTPEQRGKAMAVAMAGTPVALSVGVPAGTYMAGLTGWRTAFIVMTVIALGLMVWILAAVPNFPGAARADRLPLRRTIRLPGVAALLIVILIFVTGHNMLYNYIAPYLTRLGLQGRVDAVLLVFGLMSFLGILITGMHIDRHLRVLMISSAALFAVAAAVLAIAIQAPALVFIAAGIWGLSFGGVATLVQTALAEAAGPAGDVAQSLSVMTWNIGIAAGGVLGGLTLAGWGPAPLPWTVAALALVCLVATFLSRDGFRDRDARGVVNE